MMPNLRYILPSTFVSVEIVNIILFVNTCFEDDRLEIRFLCMNALKKLSSTYFV